MRYKNETVGEAFKNSTFDVFKCDSLLNVNSKEG